jgi:hypothetical protein
MAGRTTDWKEELGRFLKPFLDPLGHKAWRIDVGMIIIKRENQCETTTIHREFVAHPDYKVSRPCPPSYHHLNGKSVPKACGLFNCAQFGLQRPSIGTNCRCLNGDAESRLAQGHAVGQPH